jgi:hypothetical protein
MGSACIQVTLPRIMMEPIPSLIEVFIPIRPPES